MLGTFQFIYHRNSKILIVNPTLTFFVANKLIGSKSNILVRCPGFNVADELRNVQSNSRYNSILQMKVFTYINKPPLLFLNQMAAIFIIDLG
jgi:hypothetical protein